MKMTKPLTLVVLLTLLLVPAVVSSQEQRPERGSVEFGVRGFWGDVYGRPDLPFVPPLSTSKFNEYRDVRNNFFVRRLSLNFDDILGSKNYVSLQSQRAIYKDQSYLATFGQYGKFKVQFRYDEIPHTYTNTARTLYTQTSPGVYTLPLALKTALQTQSSTGTAAAISGALPSYMVTQVVCGIAIPPATQPPPCTEPFITPSIIRKAGTALLSYNVTPDWNFNFLFWREHQMGTRPIGLILNSSPSASASGQPGTTANRQSPGTGAELPEPINYFNNTVKVGTEYGKKDWGVQLGYTGSFFKNNIGSILFDNPFATADVPVQPIAPGAGCTPTAPAVSCAISAIPAHGQVDLYPDNRAHYLNFAGAFDLGKYVRVMGTVNPGWLRQNDPFLPYTANTAITGLDPLPATSMGGNKQTLAMNWTLVFTPVKKVQVTAKYRHYDYNNNTPVRDFTPIQGDVIGADTTVLPAVQAAPGEEDTAPHTTGFNKKTLELAGNWFFAKRSSVKVGYEGEWFDRSRRDVEHSFENSVFGALDLSPHKDLLFRVGLRHSDRKPELYEDEAFEGVECGQVVNFLTEEQPCHRRFDEAARVLDRADVLLQYSVQKFTFSGSFQTIQSNYNRSGGSNSPTPLNFLTGAAATTSPYFLYGALKDLSYIYTFDATYALSNEVSLFAEYTHEKYHKRMISRYRAPESFSGSSGCGPNSLGQANRGFCDSANNDWESAYRDIFDTYATGVDLYLGKKVYLTTYYSLAAGKGNVFSRALGDSTITGINRFVLTGSNTAQDYPETTTRIHEVTAVFKYKLSKNLMPKFEYRYQQFDNRDYQTSAMTPYMGCIGTTGTSVAGCPSGSASLVVSQPSVFYPYFVVGDTSAARYLFLGVDQPSYRAHYIAATIEVHF